MDIDEFSKSVEKFLATNDEQKEFCKLYMVYEEYRKRNLQRNKSVYKAKPRNATDLRKNIVSQF